MMKTVHNYKEIIKKLPMKDKYNKEELLVEEFLIEKQNNIKIYYAPHNEYINSKAKIFIIGISPGFQQMSTSMAIARKELEVTEDIKLIQYKCKVAGRFSGILRKNIISMLDEIEVNKVLNIETSKDLFYNKDYLLHTVSLIPYPVFVKGKNYSGHTPKLINNEFLMKYVYNNFINELKSLNNFKEVLLIPLGKAVEGVLLKLSEENIINKSQILIGFPHPSGANVNRKVQFQDNRENMMAQVRKFFVEKPREIDSFK